MNLEKAIEIKSRTGEEFLNTDPDEIDGADRISIEAMKAVDGFRKKQLTRPFHLLPGETKD